MRFLQIHGLFRVFEVVSKSFSKYSEKQSCRHFYCSQSHGENCDGSARRRQRRGRGWRTSFDRRNQFEALEHHCGLKNNGSTKDIVEKYVDQKWHSFNVFEGTNGANVSNLQCPPSFGNMLEIPQHEAGGSGGVL